ncbi:MAG: hypothetical protein HC824_21110, partial [Synechococcales cyanobacterium RM1_1_8]|nr:hypothetical protein [Synechococcales cyanobacterium RM1_1_8]
MGRSRQRLRLGAWGAIALTTHLALFAFPTPSHSQTSSPPQPSPLAQTNPAPAPPDSPACPLGAIEPLIDQLMLDLPSYSNRLIQRQRGPLNRPGSPALLYSIVAGQAEIQPLQLADPEAERRRSRLPPLSPPSDAAQPQGSLYSIFFTTLERQYVPRSPAPNPARNAQQSAPANPSGPETFQ